MQKQNKLACSFCGRPQEQVQKIVAGTGVVICDDCLITSLRRCVTADQAHDTQNNVVCSFCDKKPEELERIVGTDDAFICIECISAGIDAILHNNFEEPKVIKL
jgi:ATP-dependent protease Clp ATPase subunit